MSALFQETDINGMTLKNKSVRSATWTGKAEPDGRCSKELIKLLEDLALGEVGLIITGLAYVLPNGKAAPRQLGICDDDMIPDLLQLTKRVHAAGGKIAMQISHCGIQTLIADNTDLPLWGPSAVAEKLSGRMPKAMTQSEIKETVRAFANAADRVKRAGFDAVQIQAAHGWLISQLLSPTRNKRKDKYGGPIVNRARFLFEIYRAVRRSVGKDFPVLVKLNTKDFVRGGFNEKDALFVAKRLEEMGLNAIELSGGTPASGKLSAARENILRVADEAYFLPLAKKIKKQLSIPIILVGGIRSFGKVNDILKTGAADLVSMARPFIREPDLIKRWKEGALKKSMCISCSRCYGTAMSPEGISCGAERSTKQKRFRTADGGSQASAIFRGTAQG